MPADDFESRLRRVEGMAAESAWRLAAAERAVEKTAELLSRIEQSVERLQWAQEQSAASITRRQAIFAGVLVAIVSPTLSALLTLALAHAHP